MSTEPEFTDGTLADAAIDWLVAMRSGAVDRETRQAFERWYRQDAAHRRAFADAEHLWDVSSAAIEHLHAASPPSRRIVRKRSWRSAFAAAAALVLSVYLSWGAIVNGWLADYATAVGEQKQVVLSDGSTVLLNTDSAIALDWSKARRRIVLLKGQAEFTVAKDTGRPFDVVAGEMRVRALGTVFDVYQQPSGAVDVSVSEHAVMASLEGAQETARQRIEQGQRLHYERGGVLDRPQGANLHRLGAWKRGKLIFKDRPLAEAIAELNRYSKARIVLQGKNVKQLRVSGVFPTAGRDIIGALEKSFSLHALYVGPWLVILHE